MARKQRMIITLVVCLTAIGLVFSGPVWAKVEDDTITFGAAVSFTGKYSTNGKHTKNGYDLAVKRINEKGGVKVDGKPIRSPSSTTMTNPRRPVPGSWPIA